MAMMSDNRAVSSAPKSRTLRQVMPAMSIPLASIFGSAFLVIVAVLASSVGPYSLLAMVVVAIVAFQAGAVVRNNILYAEPVLEAGEKRTTLLFLRGDGQGLFLY